MSDDDRALNEPAAPADDKALAENPATFDLGAWIAGVKPVRRSVTIYGRADLLARIDELSDLETRLPAGAEHDAVMAELHDLAEQVKASRAVFTIEGRTSSYVAKLHKELTDSGAEGIDRDLALVADQIIDPPVTLADLQKLAEFREADVLRLVNVAVAANTAPVTINPRFLRGASD